MAWVFLVIAGLLEIAWAVGLRYSKGFTVLFPSVLTLIIGGFSFWFLSLALRTLPLGTAYTVWTGIGSIGTVILGILCFQESAELVRILCISLILIGIIGLKILCE